MDRLRLLAFSLEDILDSFMDKVVRILWIFGVIDLFEFINGQLKGINFFVKLSHKFLRVSRFVEFENLLKEENSFLLALCFQFFLDIFFIGGLFPDMLVHQQMSIHLFLLKI